MFPNDVTLTVQLRVNAYNYYIELASLNVSLRSEIIDQLYSELVNVTVTPYNTRSE